MPNKLTLRYIDRPGRSRQFSIPGTTLTAANFDAEHTAAMDLRTAINAMTVCANVSYAEGNDVDTGDVQPTDQGAQITNEFLVKYHYDSDPAVDRSFRIPGADLDLTDLFIGNTNICDPNQTEVAALISAFEAFATEDSGLSSVTVDTVEYLR